MAAGSAGAAAGRAASAMPPAAAALLAGLLLLAAGGAAGSPATHRVRRDAALSLDAPALASADAAPDVGVSGGALPAGAGCAPARAEPTGREQRSGRAAPRQPGPLQRAPAGPRAGVGAEAAGAAGRGAGRTGAARPEPPAPHSQAAQRDGARGAPAGRRLTEYVELTNTTELPALAAIDRSCGRLVVVWCAVKQEGEGASVYDSYLKVSLLSVLAKAPSVVPVLLFDGAADHPLAVWVRDNGGIVIVHALSFKQHMMAAATELYLWQTTTWLATFSYFDIGLVVDELRARTQARPGQGLRPPRAHGGRATPRSSACGAEAPRSGL